MTLEEMRKHPRYKWYYFLAKLNTKWKVFRYKIMNIFN